MGTQCGAVEDTDIMETPWELSVGYWGHRTHGDLMRPQRGVLGTRMAWRPHGNPMWGH